jgi:hypothetical protein
MDASPATIPDRAQLPPAIARVLDWAYPRRAALAWVTLGVMLLGVGVFLFHETRGTTLWRDEWTWALHRRGNDAGTFLRPHYGHFSLVPIAIYRLLFATAGLTDYAPYRGLVIALHLACSALVYVYARPRVGRFMGLLAAALLVFLGPASQNIIWPFQIGWLLSLCGGVGALVMLDRGDRLGDVGASLLLALSLASSGVGIPVALGLVVDVLWRRSRWRDFWILAVPLLLYGAWWLAYQTSQTAHWREDFWITPAFVFNGIANSISSLVGLSGNTTLDGPDGPLTWGTPLLLAALALTGWRLARMRSVPPRVVTLLTMMVSFWALTGLGRAFFAGPSAGRYIYVGSTFVLLLAVEVLRGVVVPWAARAVVGILVAAAAVSGLGGYRNAAADFRSQAQLTKAELGTLEIARPLVKPGYVSQGFLFNEIVAGPYFAAEKALGGTPAASPAEIAAYPEVIREAADKQLITIHDVRLVPGSAVASGGPPTVDAVAGGTASADGACIRFRPAAFANGAPAAHDFRITLPPAGVLLTADGGSAGLALRRFAGDYQPLGSLPAGNSASLRIGPDSAPQPWHLRVAPTAGASVCGLA